jgi:hypothetical protein
VISLRLCSIGCLVLLALGVAACGSQQSSLKTSAPVTLPRPNGNPSALAAVPSLASLRRLPAGVADQFLLQQDGARFAADLGAGRCTPVNRHADFSPAWSAATPNAASAAFALYRLTYDPQATPVTLSLNWKTTPPADSDCWLGLSDWSGNVWRWQQPSGGTLTLENPAQFLDGSQHCYVALLVLGETPCSLATIGFGAAPPSDGYTLVAPLDDTKTYLIDMDGNVVHQWESPYTAGAYAVLLDNGHLLRPGNLGNSAFSAGGRAGRIEEYDWDGNLVWWYELNTSTQCTHHDFLHLPNGNILLLVSNIVPHDDAVAAGRNPLMLNSGNFLIDSLVEIQPTQPSGGNVVWEWHVTDHLVQNFDDTKLNYGDPAAHPELVNFNYPPNVQVGDWIHVNGIDYNPDLDQVMITALLFNEVWIVDHSTTAAEAAGHSGGRSGHGGDLLYRWGNPLAYGAGTATDQQFTSLHNAHWIPDGLVGAGNILVFRNQTNHQMHSSLAELTAPVNPDGTYTMTGGVYGPAGFGWTYQGDPPNSFFSQIMGSAQRLPGGDTLVDSAVSGQFFMLDSSGKVKWTYQNSFPSPTDKAVFRAIRYPWDYAGVAALQ